MPKGLRFIAPVICLAAAATVLTPLVRDSGLANGLDTRLHVGNVVECAYLLGEKWPPLDWAPDVAGGRGGPNYIYYGAAGFIGPAVLFRMGMHPVDALRAWIAVCVVVGFLGAALWCWRFGGLLGALCGGTLFVYGPYAFALVYARGGYPEYTAYSLYPWLAHFAFGFQRSGRLRDLLVAAALFAAVVAVHTLSFAVVVPVILAYMYGTALVLRERNGWTRPLVLVALGCLLAAPALVGPLFQRGVVAISEQFGGTKAVDEYAKSGVPWYSMLNKQTQGEIISRALPGRAHLVCLLAACVAAASAWGSTEAKVLCLHVGLAMAALLLTEQSVAALSVTVIPVLRFLQFPLRLLAIFNLFAAPAFAACFSKELPYFAKARPVAAIAAAVLCVLAYLDELPYMNQTGFRFTSREQICKSLTTLDHENKYMPVGAKLLDYPAPAVLLEVSGGERFEVKTAVNDSLYRVRLEKPQEAKFHQYWFPGWRCEIDGNETPLRRDEEGLCWFDVPAGTHDVRLRFVRTPLHAWALRIALLGWAAVACGTAVGVIRALRRQVAALTRAGSPDPRAADRG